MPFTLSHAALALPVVRTSYFGVAAIAMMAPDLPLYMQWLWCYCVTHEYPTMFTVGIPVAFLLVLVWRMVLRPVLVEFLPDPVNERLPASWSTNWSDGWFSLWGGRGANWSQRLRAIGGVLLALAVGVSAHVLWDEFTHADRWGSEVFPWLASVVFDLPVERWFQISCSVLGLALLLWVAWRYLRQTAPAQQHRRVLPGWFRPAFWIAVVAAPVGTLTYSLVRHGGPGAGESWLSFVISAGIRGGTLVLVGTAVLTLAVVVVRSRAGVLRWNGVSGEA